MGPDPPVGRHRTTVSSRVLTPFGKWVAMHIIVLPAQHVDATKKPILPELVAGSEPKRICFPVAERIGAEGVGAKRLLIECIPVEIFVAKYRRVTERGRPKRATFPNCFWFWAGGQRHTRWCVVIWLRSCWRQTQRRHAIKAGMLHLRNRWHLWQQETRCSASLRWAMRGAPGRETEAYRRLIFFDGWPVRF